MKKNTTMFTPSKSTAKDLVDVTVLNTPQPQATSTVQRKSTLESRYIKDGINQARPKESLTKQTNVTQRTDESLGILDNISSLLAEVNDMGDVDKQNVGLVDAERELARKLLQRCSDFKTTSVIYDTNKENNGNIQNSTNNSIHTIRSEYSDPVSSNDESTLQSKLATQSVVFEPNEISARSSGLSRSSEKALTSNDTANAITFDATTAELMAQFNNEEFLSGSQMASQLSAAEASWQQNYSYALPTANMAEKEYLNLSCFSGIIGELDLSVESCAGRKMSVDEFFRRKCGNIGDLSSDRMERPSIGLAVRSPRKKGDLIPLIDSSVTTEASSIEVPFPKRQQIVSDVAKDVEEQSIMSLSSIALALQDIDNGTPRRLVDQLIMAKKKRKPVITQDVNITGDTYTVLVNSRQSMPATPSATIEKFEKDVGLLNFSTKLSLDSRVASETADVKETIPRMLSFESAKSAKLAESFRDSCPERLVKKEEITVSGGSPYKQDFNLFLKKSKLSPKYCDAEKDVSPRTSSQVHAQLYPEKISADLESQKVQTKEVIKEERSVCKDQSRSVLSDSSNIPNVVIGRCTEELCNCIVGVSKETDVELLNKSERWVICSLSINEIQGDKQNLRLTLPKDVILIKPNAEQRAKIGVKVVKMSKPIIAVLNITVADMVTRSQWSMNHFICFKPEEFNMHIPTLAQKETLDFQCIVENSVAILPITMDNRNNASIPIKLSILQTGPTVFSIDNSDELKHLTLKPQETFTTNVQCKGILSRNANDGTCLHRYEGKLMIEMENNVDGTMTIREVPLVVQVGTCKIEVIDTDIPLVVPSKQSKPFTIVNLGSTAVSITASLVQETEFLNTVKNFFVQPETLLLQSNETGCFFVTYKPQTSDSSKKHVKLKLTVSSNKYFYSIIGEPSAEAENEHFLRCETPQYLTSVSSPSSPQSVNSHRSGIPGRNSPSSSVTGSIVTGDKVPIRATHAALVWNSTKTGKSEIKEFSIRNTSNNKIKIQALISDNDKSFLFLRERQAVGTSIVLTLQRTESRTLSVIFNPHHLGAAIGKISFRHYEPKREDESRPSKVIFLYGYGGYGKIEISEVFKDISGTMWLSLGQLNSGGTLNAKLKIQNNGDLCSYAKIKLTPKALYPTMISSWQVSPTDLLLNPREIQWVTLEFRPRKEDLSLLQRSDVSHVGTMTIIHGDEPTRWRIRRLYNKIKETGELSQNESETFGSIVHPICKPFPGEQLMPDLNVIRDSVQNLKELCQGVRQHEIMLTMEICADDSLSLLHDNANDSQMFYSICSDSSQMYEGGGESFLPSETIGGGHDVFHHELDDDNFTVSPSVVVLNPPIKTEEFVTIKSSCIVAQPFETCLSHTEYLNVFPTEGMIPTRREFQLKIQCKQRIAHSFNAVLEILTENNKQDVQIKVNVKRL